MASSSSEQLLQELRDCLRRIQKSPRPIKDGNEHLVPLCEALECVFRDGLKSKWCLVIVGSRMTECFLYVQL